MSLSWLGLWKGRKALLGWRLQAGMADKVVPKAAVPGTLLTWSPNKGDARSHTPGAIHCHHSKAKACHLSLEPLHTHTLTLERRRPCYPVPVLPILSLCPPLFIPWLQAAPPGPLFFLPSGTPDNQAPPILTLCFLDLRRSERGNVLPFFPKQ